MDVAPSPNTAEFAAWLRRKREARTPKLSQERLAQAIGAERKAPQRWEKTGRIGLRNYLAVVAYLDAEPAVDAMPPDLTQRLTAIEAGIAELRVKLDRVLVLLGDGADGDLVERMVRAIVAANLERGGELGQ